MTNIQQSLNTLVTAMQMCVSETQRTNGLLQTVIDQQKESFDAMDALDDSEAAIDFDGEEYSYTFNMSSSGGIPERISRAEAFIDTMRADLMNRINEGGD